MFYEKLLVPIVCGEMGRGFIEKKGNVKIGAEGSIASSRRSVSQGATQKTAREKIKKCAVFCVAP